MIKKTAAALLLVFICIVFFDIDVTKLTEQAVDFVLQRQEELPPPSGEITPSTLAVAGKTVNIGDGLDTVMDVFGDAMDTIASEYGFTWYIYHQDYQNYIQIGLDETGTVRAAYSNSPNFEFDGLHVGSTMDETRMALGEPLESIQKGNVIFQLNHGVDGKREVDVFFFRGLYVRIFYDCFKNNTVTAIHIIEEGTELSFDRRYAQGTAEFARAMEKENFYVTNALRVREGFSPVKWSEKTHEAALSHSKDMAENNYFSHTDLSGKSAIDRVKAAGVSVSSVAENLAAGGQNGIIMHELLMNSEGHRKNILGYYEFMGVGVAFDEENRPYLTQNYYNPPKILIG